MSKSQFGQDLQVVDFYKEKRHGFFVEIGAHNGIALSNTYLLETTYQWKGICVEPIPYIFTQLVKRRLESICCDKAVYHTSGLSVEFDIANECTVLSGIAETIDCHKQKVNTNKTTIRVDTITLNDLLDTYKAPAFIEYLSLDTEGSEYDILKSCDFRKYTFGLIDVEHNYKQPRRTHIKDLLLANGYVYLGPNGIDDRYKHSSV
jgi:FkbM family methyltransferase